MEITFLNFVIGDKGGGNGWKVGENGRQLDSNEHKLSYDNLNGGMLLVSNYTACKGWNGIYDYKAGIGGDCRHVPLGEGFALQENTIYYGTSQFIHESAPLDKTVHRVLVRVTLPLDYPTLL
jgi:hypothetical protein